MEDALKIILDGSVDDAKPKLVDLSVEQLNALHAAEEKGQKRSTMLSALHAEIKRRGDDAGADGREQADGNKIDTDAKVYSQAEWDQMQNAHRDTVASMFSQEQVDGMLAQRDRTHQAEKDRIMAEANGGTALTINVESGKILEILTGSDAPGLVALKEVTQVVFVDDEDRSIETIPAMPFEPKDFEPNGNAVTLIREVDFPKELPIASVSGAFLLDDEGDPVGKATLVMPFQVGGGRTAKLAKSSLQFAA